MRHVALILIWNSHFQGTVEITGAKRSMFEVSTARNGKKVSMEIQSPHRLFIFQHQYTEEKVSTSILTFKNYVNSTETYAF